MLGLFHPSISDNHEQVIAYYFSSIFEQASFSRSEALLTSISTGITILSSPFPQSTPLIRLVVVTFYSPHSL
jgi:hypothetical protein